MVEQQQQEAGYVFCFVLQDSFLSRGWGKERAGDVTGWYASISGSTSYCAPRLHCDMAIGNGRVEIEICNFEKSR